MIALRRLVLFLIISTAVLTGHWLVATFAYLIALRYYNPYECIVLAFCIDVYFSPMGLQLWYTAGSITLFVLALLIRPYIRPQL
jgi:hypothetical protein